jgi:hypothetical protein
MAQPPALPEWSAPFLGPQASAPRCCVIGLCKAARWAHVFALVVGNVADAVTNYTVASEFYAQGETTWFAIQMAFLVVSNFVLAVFGAECHVTNWSAAKEWGWQRQLVVCFAVGPLLPLITCIAGKSCRSDGDPPVWLQDATDEPDRGTTTKVSDEGGASLADSQCMREEAAESSVSVHISEALLLRDGFRGHFRAYGLFYVDTVTGSVPQAVIQLLAIAFMGRASYAQLISLCCSLFSIMSKAVIFAASYDVKVFIISFLIVAHDVFSTFYLFSTVAAQETQKDTYFLGLAVSYLGYAWLVKVFVFAACYVVGGVALTADKVMQDGDSCCVRVVVLALGALTVAPALLVTEFLRLGTYSLLRVLAERQKNQEAAVGIATVWNFVRNDNSAGSRLRHVVECLMAHDVAHGDLGYARVKHVAPVESLAVYRNTTQYLDRMIPPSTTQASLEDTIQYSSLAVPIKSDFELLYLRPVQYFAPFWNYVKSIGPDGPFTMWDVERWTRCSTRVVSFPRTQRTFFALSRVMDAFWHAERKDRVVLLVGYVGFAIFALGQILSFVYPFINASVNFHSHNLLQAVCFYGLCATLLLALPFVPATYRHQVFRWSMCSLPTPTFQVDSVRTWIQWYYTPTVATALQLAVDASIVPTEVMAAVVAPFVGSAVDMAAMTRVECLTVRAACAQTVTCDSVDNPVPTEKGEIRKNRPRTDSQTEMHDRHAGLTDLVRELNTAESEIRAAHGVDRFVWL